VSLLSVILTTGVTALLLGPGLLRPPRTLDEASGALQAPSAMHRTGLRNGLILRIGLTRADVLAANLQHAYVGI
jgi:hypothetical protein